MSDVLKNFAEVRGTIGKCLDVDCISAVFFCWSRGETRWVSSCTSWAAISRRSRWTFFSPKGRPWVHCVRISAQTWLHLLLPTNHHLIDIYMILYVTICATLCKALHPCFVAKIHCGKCVPPSTSSISSTKTLHTNQSGPSKDKTTP